MWPFSRSQPSSGEDGPATAALAAPSPPRILEEPASPSEPESPAPSSTTTTATIESPASLSRHGDFNFTGYPNERLSIPPGIRWPVLLCFSSVYGFSLGAARGGRIAADRYRAMNAHRLPATQAGWYLYHRSKSYNTTVGAVKRGVAFGGILSFWVSLFMLAEEGLDQARGRVFARKSRGEEVKLGQRDFANTTMAALMTVGVYSRWHRMDVFATTKLAGMAFKFGIAYGVAQDAVSVMRGEPPGYVAWVGRKVLGRAEGEGAT